MSGARRENWPALIADLETAGISNYKLAEMLKPSRGSPRCQVGQVKRWANAKLWLNGTEPSHWIGEQIKIIHAEYVAHAVSRETIKS